MPAIPANITVPFESISHTEGFIEGRFVSTIVMQCAWASRLTLARELIGNATLAAAGGTIDYTLPAPHPYMTGAFVKDIPSIVGFSENPDYDQSGAGSRYADHQYARLTVNYEIPQWGNAPPTSGGSYHIEENIEGSTEFRTAGVSGLEWADGALLDPLDAPTRQARKLVFTFRIAGIPRLPFEVLTLMGCSNERTILFNTLGLSVGPETLLYAPPSLRRFVYASGAGAWDATFRFPYDPEGHNKFYRTGYTAKEPVYTRLGGNLVQWKPFTPRRFDALGVKEP